MGNEEFEPERIEIVRVDHDADLVDFLTRFCREEGIATGTFTAIGAFKEVNLGFYDQESHEYGETKVNRPCEMASCTGNVSSKEGEPFVHAHAVVADEEGEVLGGHLGDSRVFAAEVHLQVLEGPELERKHDEVTDLSLWDL